jgi:hypothetical protein
MKDTNFFQMGIERLILPYETFLKYGGEYVTSCDMAEEKV